MNDKWEILHGDALKLLGGFAPGAFDAVITDPPYASGGRTQAEKNKSTAKKYSSMGDHAPPPFDGDATKEVLPTPGGPTKQRIEPLFLPVNLRTAKNSKMRFLTFSRP